MENISAAIELNPKAATLWMSLLQKEQRPLLIEPLIPCCKRQARLLDLIGKTQEAQDWTKSATDFQAELNL